MSKSLSPDLIAENKHLYAIAQGMAERIEQLEALLANMPQTLLNATVTPAVQVVPALYPLPSAEQFAAMEVQHEC